MIQHTNPALKLPLWAPRWFKVAVSVTLCSAAPDGCPCGTGISALRWMAVPVVLGLLPPIFELSQLL